MIAVIHQHEDALILREVQAHIRTIHTHVQVHGDDRTAEEDTRDLTAVDAILDLIVDVPLHLITTVEKDIIIRDLLHRDIVHNHQEEAMRVDQTVLYLLVTCHMIPTGMI